MPGELNYAGLGLTIAVSGGRIKSVSGAATVQPDAGVRSYCIIASLMLQALVIINLTLVHI